MNERTNERTNERMNVYHCYVCMNYVSTYVSCTLCLKKRGVEYSFAITS